MKRIRKYMIGLLCFVIGMTIVGCGGKKDMQSDSDSVNINQEQMVNDTIALNDSVAMVNKVIRDSIQILNKRIDESLVNAQTVKTHLEDEVSSLKGMVWALGGFCTLCLLLSFIVVMWCKKLKEQGIAHHRSIKDLQNKMPEEKAVAASSPIKKISTQEYLDLKDRITRVETAMRTMSANAQTPTVPVEKRLSSPQPRQKEEKKMVKAYFGNPSLGDLGGYFRKQFDYFDSDARFAAEISENKAIFTPIIDSEAAKKTLLTSDQMKLAVEFSGCTPSEMKAMKVQSAGVAEKKENDRWVIVKKVQIQLM